MTTNGIDTVLADPPDSMRFSPPAEDRCVNYETCGNTTRGNNAMCTECLDAAREAGHGRGDE